MNESNSKSGIIVEIEMVIKTYFDILYKGEKDLIESKICSGDKELP